MAKAVELVDRATDLQPISTQESSGRVSAGNICPRCCGMWRDPAATHGTDGWRGKRRGRDVSRDAEKDGNGSVSGRRGQESGERNEVCLVENRLQAPVN
jgi:hypothetical protein